jgi:hypothetical protein
MVAIVEHGISRDIWAAVRLTLGLPMPSIGGEVRLWDTGIPFLGACQLFFAGHATASVRLTFTYSLGWQLDRGCPCMFVAFPPVSGNRPFTSLTTALRTFPSISPRNIHNLSLCIRSSSF